MAQRKSSKGKSTAGGTARRASATAAELAALREAFALGDAIGRLGVTEDVEAIFEKLLHCAALTLGTEEGSIAELNPQRQELRFRAAHSVAREELKKLRVPISSGVLGYVARSGQPLAVHDVSRDERFDARVDEAVGFTTRSILATPILHDNRVLGVLELVNVIGDEEVGSEDLAILGLFADVAAGVLVRERQRAGAMAFVERAIQTAGLPAEPRAQAKLLASKLRDYKNDDRYRSTLKMAGLLRSISEYGDDATRYATTMLDHYLQFLETK